MSPPLSVEPDDLMTVGEILGLEVIQRSGPTYYGTDAQLSRTVQWVHPTEISDIAKFLTGGEAVLTSGLGFGKDGRQQREYIRSLATAGVAVLVIEVAGRAFAQLPNAILDEATRVGLPIIAAAAEFPFAAVTSQVHRRIVSSQVQTLQAVERASAEFGDLVAADADHVQIVEQLASIVRCPVVLEDAVGEIRGYAGGTALTDALISDWRRHWVAEHSGSPAPSSSQSAGSTDEPHGDRPHPCVMARVMLRGKLWGHLHVLSTQASPHITPYVAERAGTFIAITLLNERVDRARRTIRQSALLSRLLTGGIGPNAFVREALAMGVDLRSGPFVAISIAPASSAHDRQQRDGEAEPAAAEGIAASLSRAGVATLVQVDSHGDFLIAALRAGRTIEVVRKAVEATHLSAGMSGVVASINDVPTAMVEARQAMAVASTTSPGRLLEAKDLGLFGLLVELAERPSLRAFVERELGPLLTSTDAAGLETLAAYAEAGFNKAAAAEILHVQRRTLYYRLDKISSRLEVDLEDATVRTRLAVAMAAASLLGLSGDDRTIESGRAR